MSRHRSEFFAICPRGLETALAAEIERLGATTCETLVGGVRFSGPFHFCYEVNLHSRIASRVLWKVHHAPYRQTQDIYNMCYRLPWPSWLSVEHRIKVKVSAQHSPLESLDYTTLRIKDAICDHFAQKGGARPFVDKHKPDIQIHAFVDATHCTIYLDTSGEALFKRGLRAVSEEAPLRENLAAGILRVIGWTPEQPLYDPMCGSGTFLLEAAQIALGIPPGLNRRFAFERFNNFDRQTWQAIRHTRSQAALNAGRVKIYGSDVSERALHAVSRNLERAGLAQMVHLTRQDILESTAPADKGLLISNPPYGVRSAYPSDPKAFYAGLGNLLKQRYCGWTAYFLTADSQLEKSIRLSATRRIPLFNGPLECRLYEYRIVAGSNRRNKREPAATLSSSGAQN